MALTTIDPALQNTQAQYTGFKNRIINGAMMIDQRNAGAAVTAGATYPVDRFSSYRSGGTGAYTAQQSSTAPAGFRNSIVATVTSTGTPTESSIYQVVEGYNVADMGFGAAGASTFTLSFWVRSSVTGTYSVSFRAAGGARSYVTTYAINVANTWEQKTVTVAGDTSGTWNTTNGAGLIIDFSLGQANLTTSTLNAWQGGNYVFATGATNLMATNGATFYITGVQLEKGSTATSFDYRPYGTELALCQRYFQKSYRQSVAAGSSFADINGDDCFQVSFGTSASGSIAGGYVSFPVEMRATPTLTVYDSAGTAGVSTGISAGGSGTNGLGLNVKFASARGIILRIYGASYYGFSVAYKVEAEL